MIVIRGSSIAISTKYRRSEQNIKQMGILFINATEYQQFHTWIKDGYISYSSAMIPAPNRNCRAMT